MIAIHDYLHETGKKLEYFPKDLQQKIKALKHLAAIVPRIEEPDRKAKARKGVEKTAKSLKKAMEEYFNQQEPAGNKQATQEPHKPELTAEVHFARRVLYMAGKERSRSQVSTLLKDLQKAIKARGLVKKSPYAALTNEMQTRLKALYNVMLDYKADSIQVKLNSDFKKRLEELVEAHRFTLTLSYIRRFINLQGAEPDRQKAKRLKEQIKNALESGKISKEDPQRKELIEVDTLLDEIIYKDYAYMDYQANLTGLGCTDKDSPSRPMVAPAWEPEEEEEDFSSLIEDPFAEEEEQARPGQRRGKLSVAEIERMEFDMLPFKGKWLDFIGEPQKNFYAIVFGKPKNGKSYFSFQFAKYLSRFGRVLYNAAEEGFVPTLVKKQRETGITAQTPIDFTDGRTLAELKKDLDSGNYAACFIDSISILTKDNREFDDFRRKYPHVAFICIMHATKGGDFKGSQAWTHDCDIIIKVEAGLADQKGRFGQGEMDVFAAINSNQ